MLAAHRNNYEILKCLLDRGATLPVPHDVRCGCDDCMNSSQTDSLRHSQSRINAYRALSSSSLIALSSRDPIMTAFELSWELRRLSRMETEFRTEYNVSKSFLCTRTAIAQAKFESMFACRKCVKMYKSLRLHYWIIRERLMSWRWCWIIIRCLDSMCGSREIINRWNDWSWPFRTNKNRLESDAFSWLINNQSK